MNSKDITKEKEHLENDLIEMRQRRAKYISEVDETTAQVSYWNAHIRILNSTDVSSVE